MVHIYTRPKNDRKCDGDGMKMRIAIGDWSNDGHGKCEDIIIEVNKDIDELREAYKRSCREYKIYVHFGQEKYDFASLGLSFADNMEMELCGDYGENYVNEIWTKFLTEQEYPRLKNVTGDLGGYKTTVGEYEFLEIIMWFIGLTTPDLEWEVVNEEIPYWNGYWAEGFNISLGYGLYD